jgi:hypothetical protein
LRAYECKKEHNGVHLVLSSDSSFTAAMVGMRWRLLSSMGQLIFSLPRVRPAARKYKEKKRRRGPNLTC